MYGSEQTGRRRLCRFSHTTSPRTHCRVQQPQRTVAAKRRASRTGETRHADSVSGDLLRWSIQPTRDLLHVSEEASGEPVVHVIDDDDSFRRGMLRILHALGYAAVGYGCAGEFLLTVRGEPAGCILLDISMPGPSGIDLLRGLMQRGSVSPTIFVTARDDVMTSVNAMKMGAFDYLVKPVTAERLCSGRGASHARGCAARRRSDTSCRGCTHGSRS